MSYITEEQQVEELKSWWKENSKVIITTFILVVAGVLGWRYWQTHQISSQMATSNSYEQVTQAYLQNPQANAELLQKFVDDNKNSSYAVLALFTQAKSAVEQNNLPLAESSLQQALQLSANDELKSISALRLAELQVQQQQYDQAEISLKSVTDKAWESSQQQLSGDILLAKGDKNAARQAYRQALSSENLNNLDRQLLQLKVDSLSE
ncbi:Putative negative regulator of RcsB-dependent stress response [Pasteurella testudinis DSM 23072]|uniref:Ancillary SecYEG translocon subunit n=1 Tax=Pasteurella testudinis DSM 23072 TaxID=1122938 RepID=A0A1W1UHI2_9PAST|nr:tetratricopeptide repeat protein [Pasteurella testudinis]SMB80565.1 Putative negative regulator of RcsB-dependent stress response [Pasteurella testudinis DSM 23072]SUB51922.1 tetratricopeptide-like helical family protein [Pasteurella testudinis]